MRIRHTRERGFGLLILTALAVLAAGGGAGLAAGDPSATRDATDIPAITSAGTATAVIGQAFSYQVTATNAPTGFGASGLPPGLAVDATTGLISGTPTVLGSWYVTLAATNALGTSNKAVLVQVIPSPVTAPVITSAGSASASVGLPFSYQIVADNAPTSFGAAGLPAGLAVDSASGLISGTPTAAGTALITLSAGNSLGTGTGLLTLTVVDAAPPVITTTRIDGTVGSPLTCTIAATNAPTSFTASILPAGLTLDAATGTISGIPSVAGQSAVTVGATNAAGTGNAVVTIGIVQAAAGAPVITSATSATATVGVQFTYGATALNAPFSFGADNLPTGLSMAPASGVISGVPTTAGSSAVILTATNASGSTFTTMTIRVLPAGTAASPVDNAVAAAQGCGLGNGVAAVALGGLLAVAMAMAGRRRN